MYGKQIPNPSTFAIYDVVVVCKSNIPEKVFENQNNLSNKCFEGS